MTADGMAEIDRLLDEANAWDPAVGIAAGVLASRHGITTDEARTILHQRCPDPAALHDYCDGINASTDGTSTRLEREQLYADMKKDFWSAR